MMLPMMITKEGFLWKAYPMVEVKVHTEECEDPECRGGLMPASEPLETAFTLTGLHRKIRRSMRRVVRRVIADMDADAQKAASESLGG